MDTEKLNAVIKMTGADYETATAALATSDGDVDIAVRIIRTYDLRDAPANGANSSSKNGQQMPGSESGQQGETKSGTQENQSKTDEQIPLASDILEAIKDIWKKGNASRLDIEKNGKTLLGVSLTVGTIGLVLAPVAALIGIGAALITDYKIIITLDNGTKINVNEFAITHKQTNS
jgi:hypothetical protein